MYLCVDNTGKVVKKFKYLWMAKIWCRHHVFEFEFVDGMFLHRHFAIIFYDKSFLRLEGHFKGWFFYRDYFICCDIYLPCSPVYFGRRGI